jgi:hypothetical protein
VTTLAGSATSSNAFLVVLVPPSLANPVPSRPCGGRWPFAPVLAVGQFLQAAAKVPQAKTGTRKSFRSFVVRRFAAALAGG